VPNHSGLHTDLKIYFNEALQADTIAKARLSVIVWNSEELLVEQQSKKLGGFGTFRSQTTLQ